MFNQVVIFVKSVQRATYLDKLLQECNFPSITIHAKLTQAGWSFTRTTAPPFNLLLVCASV
jgi:hypothetical protein